MDQVETMAKKVGIDGIPEINKEMGKKLEVLKVLDAMDGRKVPTKGGLGREALVDVAGAGGEMAGNAMGIPFAGTLASRGFAGSVARRLASPKSAVSKLSKFINPKTSLKRGLVDTAKGLAAQSLAK